CNIRIGSLSWVSLVLFGLTARPYLPRAPHHAPTAGHGPSRSGGAARGGPPAPPRPPRSWRPARCAPAAAPPPPTPAAPSPPPPRCLRRLAPFVMDSLSAHTRTRPTAPPFRAAAAPTAPAARPGWLLSGHTRIRRPYPVGGPHDRATSARRDRPRLLPARRR